MSKAASLHLSFKRAHRSIKNLPDTVLPGFSVITGVNGVGKSHLIEAIIQGAVEIKGVPHEMNLIKHFDWNSFSPQIAEVANPASLRNERETALRTVFAHLTKAQKQPSDWLTKSAQIAGDARVSDVHWLAAADKQSLQDILLTCSRQGKTLSKTDADAFSNTFLEMRARAGSEFSKQISSFGELGAILSRRSETLGCNILALSERDVREHMPLTWTPSEALHFQFARWFAAWHGAWEFNKINRYYATQENDKDRHYLSDDTFRQRYGPEPWKLTNRVLLAAGVRYRFNHPSASFQGLEQNFELRLIDPEDHNEVKMADLSSGEKALLAVILLLYQTSGETGLARMPRVLLLDEVDSHLHPTYAKVLIDILYGELVEKCGISIILITHAPSTVALAPEGHVFELARKPRQIRAITSSQAAQILSSGFISVTPTDIVVITESSADPAYYQFAHDHIESRGLLKIPSLRFIPASNKNTDGEGGGCGQVQNWAPKLHSLGLERFRGLIDRDSGNVENSVVKVTSRHSVENYIYDPLTVSAFLIHHGIFEPFVGLNLARMNASELLKMEQLQIQDLVDQLCGWIANKSALPLVASEPKTLCSYLGFGPIKISNWWLEERGKNIERALQKTLNPMAHSLHCAAPIKDDRSEIIRFQIKVLPELLSAELVEIFLKLHD